MSKTTPRNRRLFPILAILVSAALSCGDAADDAKARATSPLVPAAEFSGRTLDDGRIQITAIIPDRHHAYLDSGDEGNLIPIFFQWDGPAPEKVTAPPGERDEDVKARVLRGQGVFVFEPGAAGTPEGVKVQSQVCDEDKGICYRPLWQDVSLK